MATPAFGPKPKKATATSSTSAASAVGASTNQASVSKSFPSKTMPTVPKRWESQDLDLLRSGLFADAKITCAVFGGGSPRKDQIHRNILAARSGWFNKAFSGDYQERKDGKVVLKESRWHVNLMLYFFYSGGINLSDENLTAGKSVMKISIELLRLGSRFESESMQDYGKELLVTYLTELLDHFYGTDVSKIQTEARFLEQADFPTLFCDAVRDVFSTAEPIESAQRILADFAFAAHSPLFANKEFVAFVEGNQVPDFGNLVLTALIKGPVSAGFTSSNTFQKLYQDWLGNP